MIVLLLSSTLKSILGICLFVCIFIQYYEPVLQYNIVRLSLRLFSDISITDVKAGEFCPVWDPP